MPIARKVAAGVAVMAALLAVFFAAATALNTAAGRHDDMHAQWFFWCVLVAGIAAAGAR